MTRSDWLSAASIVAGSALVVSHVALVHGWVESLWVVGVCFLVAGVAGGVRR